MEQSAIEAKSIQGGCYCGRIQYQVQLPVKWCVHCHCSNCRHIQGAPFVTWFGVDKTQFNQTKGKADVAWFESSENAKRGHCIHCGTPLFFLGDNWADEIHITRESTQQNILQKPQLHVFYDRHIDYIRLYDDLDKYGGQDGFTPLTEDDAQGDQ